ncbi:hypothetical protein [Caulobacter phage Cr30]|uniref:hypothetical protein n=1 Tax=Caulobacter phage Cr30 TaxID=1357714 RepID=UPI0004A9B538|nr:hypothetical protein OZ74_gp001 [Caulobacter phage Cr30]AGS80886.1 hypothetical protein [Caulobacter phage Cr30]
MNEQFNLNEELIKKVLETVDVGLVSGVGNAIPGQMCVEAAVCYAMGLPHCDEPICVSPAIRLLKITLNDANWSSEQARAKGLRKLAVLQLGTKNNFDDVEFASRISMFVVNGTVANLFDKLGFVEHAKNMREAKTLGAAARAAADAAAADAAYAAADAAYAAYAAADAARAAADAAYAAADAAYAAYAAADAADAAAYADANFDNDYDQFLTNFAENVSNILIEMNVPAVQFLHLL